MFLYSVILKQPELLKQTQMLYYSKETLSTIYCCLQSVAVCLGGGADKRVDFKMGKIEQREGLLLKGLPCLVTVQEYRIFEYISISQGLLWIGAPRRIHLRPHQPWSPPGEIFLSNRPPALYLM